MWILGYRILFICWIDFSLILKIYLCAAGLQSALSLVGAKVLEFSCSLSGVCGVITAAQKYIMKIPKIAFVNISIPEIPFPTVKLTCVLKF